MFNELITDPSKRPEINLLASEEVVRLPDGRVVKRQTMSTGNVVDTLVYPGDFPDARKVKN